MFIDRIDAGRRLAERLEPMRGHDVVVLGLPRGGVPVALEVARALGAPLDVIVVRKLGVPYQPELAMGADRRGRCAGRQRRRAAPRPYHRRRSSLPWRRPNESSSNAARRRFRGDRQRVSLHGRTAIVVDDGIATGSTALAACQVARAHGASRVVLAVPVAPPGSTGRFGDRRRRAGLPGDAEAVLLGRPVVLGLLADDRRGGRRLPRPRRRPPPPRRHRPPAAGRDDPLESTRRCRSGPGDPSRRTPHRATRGDRDRGVRARERQQPAQPSQPVRRRGAEPSRAGDAAVRPAHRRGGGRPGERVRRRAARPATHRRDPGVAGESRRRRSSDRILRRQHRGRSGPVGRRRARRRRRCRRVARRSPRPRRQPPRGRDCADAAHRRQPRRGGARNEPPRPSTAPVREPPRRRSGRQPPVRGAGHPRRGGGAGSRLVRRPSHAVAEPSRVEPCRQCAQSGHDVVCIATRARWSALLAATIVVSSSPAVSRIDQPDDVAQDQRRTLPRREQLEGGDVRQLDRSPGHGGRRRVRVTRRDLVEQVVGIRLQPGELGDRRRRRRPAMRWPAERIEAGVRRDAIQPGPQPRVGVETLTLTPRAERSSPAPARRPRRTTRASGSSARVARDGTARGARRTAGPGDAAIRRCLRVAASCG